MDFTTIKDMSIGNLKIKEICYNNNILYQDNAKRELTLLSFGTGIADVRYVAPAYMNVTDSNTLSLQKFGTGIVNIS